MDKVRSSQDDNERDIDLKFQQAMRTYYLPTSPTWGILVAGVKALSPGQEIDTAFKKEVLEALRRQQAGEYKDDKSFSEDDEENDEMCEEQERGERTYDLAEMMILCGSKCNGTKLVEALRLLVEANLVVRTQGGFDWQGNLADLKGLCETCDYNGWTVLSKRMTVRGRPINCNSLKTYVPSYESEFWYQVEETLLTDRDFQITP